MGPEYDECLIHSDTFLENLLKILNLRKLSLFIVPHPLAFVCWSARRRLHMDLGAIAYDTLSTCRLCI